MNATQNPSVPLPEKIMQLMNKGVAIPDPRALEIGDDVDIDRISGKGVVLHRGTKLYGSKILICSGVKLGYEAPVTVVDCQLGPDVELKGGFFKASVFLEKANMAGGAHVREGCLLEEEVSGSHTVGLKQTILFPFVTLGSLINFCDCFMAGGTSRKNHSEVGSSYIHFNYTANQDKATASLIGDVPKGVMLRETPIFLGGQGGLVGPVRIGYGTVIAAGTVYRGDCPEGGKLLGGSPECFHEEPFHMGFYRDVKKRVCNNIYYMANLLALKHWYARVRKPFFATYEMGNGLYEGAANILNAALNERLTRFQALSEKMETSIKIGEKILKGGKKKILLRQQKELLENWSDLAPCFAGGEEQAGLENRRLFLEGLKPLMDQRGEYVRVIQGMDSALSQSGIRWLQQIVDGILNQALNRLPSYRDR